MIARDRLSRAGMTLIELLVVIAIIGVLIGLLMPAIQFARNSARRSQCLSQLRQVGLAMETYMEVRGTRALYPDLAQLPTATPASKLKPTLIQALGPFIEDSTSVFNCPGDVGSPYFPTSYTGENFDGQSYFAIEGLSYEYQAGRFAKLTRQEVLSDTIRDPNNPAKRVRTGNQRSSSTVFVANDYEAFHGSEGEDGCRNYVYLDGHADSVYNDPTKT